MRRAGLVDPFATPALACAAIGGVQAQIVPAAGLALWNRTRGFTHAALERGLYDDRTLIKLWGQRHTLHLYPSHEWAFVHAVVSSRETWWERQFIARGGDATAHRAVVARVTAMLEQRGTLGRGDLRAADLGLPAELLSSWGGIFAELVRRGVACHAKPVGSDGRFAHRTHWLQDLAWDVPDSESANIEFARRYLRTYAPASTQDFAYWRGARVGDAARWIAALGDEVSCVRMNGRDAWMLREDLAMLGERPPPRSAWPVRMLYRFDPLLLAHRDKDWAVAPEFYDRVWRPAGHIEGIVLVHGRAAATWRYERDEDDVAITVHPFEALDARTKREIEAGADGVAGYFEARLSDVKINAVRRKRAA